MKKLLRLLLLGVSALAFAAPATAGGQPNTLVVDRDRVECPNAEFVSIQEAVDAAEPGDKIKVCPDLYTEFVTVDRPLTLSGEIGAVESEDCFTTTTPDPTRQAIVEGPFYSFNLQANDIVLEGFVVQGAMRGIRTGHFSGYTVRHNLVQANTLDGMNFATDGAMESRVYDNCFRNNARGGLVSELGNLHNARIDHNETFANRHGIVLAGAGSRLDVTVDHNRSRNDQFAIGISNSRASRIVDNDVANAGQAAIAVNGANVGLEISSNRLRASTAGIFFARRIFLPEFGANSRLDVSNNDIERNRYGILAFPNALHISLIANNQISENEVDGVRLQALNNGNTVRNNHVYRNGRNGIYAQLAAFNVFDGNHMRDSGEFDARDDLRETNVWTDNHCVTDFPPGAICGVD